MANSSEKPAWVQVSFESDGFVIEGDLHLPERKNPPVVVGSHGLFANRQSPKQRALAEACVAEGIAYFRFDHRGCGKSGGGLAEQCGFEARWRDLAKACDIVRQRDDTGDALALFGSSLGGATVCRVFSMVRPASAVVYATPVDSACIFEHAKRYEGPNRFPSYFFENLLFDNGPLLPELARILVVHGELDEMVPVSSGEKIHDAAGEPKKLIVQKQGDHRMSDRRHQVSFVEAAADWFRKGFSESGFDPGGD